VILILARQDFDRARASLDRAIALEPAFALPYALRAYVRCKKTEWLPATADLLLAIRRLALIEFNVWIEESRRDYERFRLCMRAEYKNEKAAPLGNNEASNLERETIEFGVSSLLAAMFAPSNETMTLPATVTRSE
jgi:hypothetical protein